MQPSNISRYLLRCAIVYALLGTGLLAAMSIQQNFTNSSFYLYVSLVGWVPMILMALTYRVFPDLTHCPWAKVQFWAHNLGLPVMLIGVYGAAHQLPFSAICMGIGSLVVAVAFVAFAINAWRNAH